MPRNSKGLFTSSSVDISIALLSFIGSYKILIIAVLIFPCYAIISNRNISRVLFIYLLGTNYTNPNCPKCECPKQTCECKVPQCECEVCQKCQKCDCPTIREMTSVELLNRCTDFCVGGCKERTPPA